MIHRFVHATGAAAALAAALLLAACGGNDTAPAPTPLAAMDLEVAPAAAAASAPLAVVRLVQVSETAAGGSNYDYVFQVQGRNQALPGTPVWEAQIAWAPAGATVAQGTAHFALTPPNEDRTSSNTVALRIDRSQPFSASALGWTFATTCARCLAGSVTGTAAAGAPLADASVTLFDSTGTSRSAAVDAAGNYVLDVTGLTGPFLLRAMGHVGGQPVIYHSVALAADVPETAVNITPLTDALTAAVMGVPNADLRALTAADATRLTPAGLAAAVPAVKAQVQAVLDAAGAGGADIRTTEFVANSAGLDLALDGIRVVWSGSSAALQPVGGTLAQAGDAGAGLKALADALSSAFKSGVPDAATLLPFFADGFLHQGQSATGYIDKVLRAARLQAGALFDQAKVQSVEDADHVWFSMRVSPGGHQMPFAETMRASKVGGQWRLAGDGHLIGADVYATARIVELPATQAAVLALGAVPIEDGSPYLVLPVKDAAGNNVAYAWLGQPSDDFFGVIGWVGDTSRALRAQYNVYLATPSARVRNYLAFEMANERVGAAVDTIHVSGPGLPAAGLVFTRSTTVNPRDSWIIRADAFNWFTFNSERCAQVDRPSSPIPDCAFDWSAVQTGSTYTLQALDAAGGVLDTITRNLPAKPLDADALFANRAALFPQFSAAGTPEFSVRNIYDAAGPFVFGKTVHLSWSAPTAPGAQMLYVSYNTNHLVPGDPNGADTSVTQSVALYGTLPLPTSAEFTANDPNPLTWAWSTLAAADFFGNRYEHEVSGLNPH